ncbi:MAG: hypothetical protein KDI76_13730, partial [Xanthomonadales bacterium]|nr:hypothetical protein [Xanthomonadales bacterium]
MNIEQQKQELAATIIIEFLTKERKKFLGKMRIKKFVTESDQKLENLIYEATNFESKIGPLMPTPWEKYFKASWFQIAEGSVGYNDKSFKKFSV